MFFHLGNGLTLRVPGKDVFPSVCLLREALPAITFRRGVQKKSRPHHPLVPFLFTLFLVTFLLVIQDALAAERPQLETRRLVLMFQDEKVLELFDERIGFGQAALGKARGWNQEGTDLRKRVAGKMDALFQRVQEILDMRKELPKVRILICENRQQLDKAYSEFYGGKRQHRAFYRFEDNTVYVTVEDVHKGMIAHELAHAVIDHFFQVRPPVSTAEILARYVDAHLE